MQHRIICVALFFILAALCLIDPCCVVAYFMKKCQEFKFEPELVTNDQRHQNEVDWKLMRIVEGMTALDHRMKIIMRLMKKMQKKIKENEEKCEESAEDIVEKPPVTTQQPVPLPDDIVETPPMQIQWPGPNVIENFVEFTAHANDLMNNIAKAIGNHIINDHPERRAHNKPGYVPYN